jgi:DNA adenine methylase
MVALQSKLRSPLKTHGGKSYLARRIIALFPDHDVYCEPFGAGLSVLLNKPWSAREVVGDINPDLMNFYRVLVDDTDRILDLVEQLPYDEAMFVAARDWLVPGQPALLRAVGFLVRNRFSRGGLGSDFAWSDRLRGGQPGDLNAWHTIQTELPAIARRLRGVELHCGDALTLIRSTDGPGTLHYLDPVYIPETRTARQTYAHEMVEGQHQELLSLACQCQGKVFLSGYRHPLYDVQLTGWTRHEFAMPNHAGQGKTKQRRTECLWESP